MTLKFSQYGTKPSLNCSLKRSLGPRRTITPAKEKA